MSDGIQPQEIVEVPQEIKKESEAKQDLDKATFEAPSKVEEGDIQAAEKGPGGVHCAGRCSSLSRIKTPLRH